MEENAHHEKIEQLLSYYDQHGSDAALFPVTGASEWWTGETVALLRDMLPEWSAFRTAAAPADDWTPTHYSVRDEYAPRFGRERLTLWSGAFASTFEGQAWELPNRDGYMVTLDYLGSVRVTCETPRTDENYARVDDALNKAAQTLETAAHNARRSVAA